jgi:glycosyltransferase involved in cell wall biosynthesis
VAEILARAGIHMGPDRNRSGDNLWFTLLLKRPRWLARRLDGDGREIVDALRIFERAMLGHPPRSTPDLLHVTRATAELARHGHNPDGEGRGAWAFQRARSLLRSRPAPAGPWGWKEPVTFVLLPFLQRHFGTGIRYVHVIRNGLDVALSRNQQDLSLWGERFGVPPVGGGADPAAALRFWAAANRWAIAEATRLFGERFLLVDYDRLCADPRREVERLVAFAGAPRPDLDALAELPDDRARSHRAVDLSVFDPRDVADLAEFGYEAPAERPAPRAASPAPVRSSGSGLELSIALCTFDGAAFLPEQLSSILSQTRPPDEVVVSDDGSSDETMSILEAFRADAPFPVRLERNARRLGFVANFEQTIARCRGDVVFLCDQDDVWHRRKLATVERALARDPGVGGAFTDADLIDEGSRALGYGLWESLGFTAERRRRFVSGDVFQPDVVTGATLAFRTRFHELVFPVPPGMVHDAWIALLVAMVSELRPIPDPLVRYRVHQGQQIGVPDRDLRSTAGHRFSELRRRATKDERGAFIEAAARYDEAVARVRERADRFAPRPGAVEAVEDHARHLRARAQDGAAVRRITTITAELARGRYHRHSGGLRSAAKDLLRPDRMRGR